MVSDSKGIIPTQSEVEKLLSNKVAEPKEQDVTLEFYRYICEGLGLEFDKKKIRLYRFLDSVDKILYRYQKGYLYTHSRVLNCALEEISEYV